MNAELIPNEWIWSAMTLPP